MMKRIWFGAPLLAGAWLATGGAARASTYQVIYNLSLGAGPLSVTATGQLYGVAFSLVGTRPEYLFQLTPPVSPSTAWQGKVAYNYTSAASADDRGFNQVTPIGDGSLLGTSVFGGAVGYGAVYALSKPAPGTFTVLHAFTGTPNDGQLPFNGLVAGPDGGVFGVTETTIYEISGSIADPHYATISNFSGTSGGYAPGYGLLAVDTAGNIFGATDEGSAISDIYGTVYMLSTAGGVWTRQTIFDFGGADGNGFSSATQSNLLVDAGGNVYGCGANGSHYNQGGIYRLNRPAQPGGAWTLAVLYEFGAQPNDPFVNADGCFMTFDPASGRIYGDTYFGGANRLGTVFELDPPAAGQTAWSETVVHSFDGSATDGAHPQGAPAAHNGVFYGSTSTGSIWSVTP